MNDRSGTTPRFLFAAAPVATLALLLPATDLLAFESRGWIHTGPKEQAIRTDLGLSPTRYYQLLAKAMNDPAAVAAYPATAARLRRFAAQKADLKWRVRYG